MRDTVQKLRLAKASAVVALLVACVPAADALRGALLPASQAQAQAGAAYGGLDSATLIGDADALGFLERLEAEAGTLQGQPSEAFEREIGLPAAGREVRANEAGTVVSYILDGTPDEALAAVTSHMSQRGWNAVSLGSVEGATFVKEGGSLTWTLVTCTQTDATTSVVFRCPQ